MMASRYEECKRRPRNGHTASFSGEGSRMGHDQELFITLDHGGDSDVRHISDIRYHYSDHDAAPGDKPFYYKPYVHLQQMHSERRAKRSGLRRQCFPWRFCGRRKTSKQPIKHSECSWSTSAKIASQHRCACSGGKAIGAAGCNIHDKRAGHLFCGTSQDPRDISLKDYWFNFLSQTSWHGCRLVVDPNKRLFIRIIFFLIVIVTSLALTNIALNLTKGALDFKTVTRTMVFVDTERRFPTVTICNMCPFSFRGKNESDPFFRILANASELRHLLPPITITDPEFERFLRRSADELFKEYVMELGLVHGSYGEVAVTEDDFHKIFTEDGPCYQFNSPFQAATRGHWNVTSHGRNSGLRLMININQDDYGIVFENNAGLRVFISHATESPDLKSSGVNIMPGASTRLALTQNEYSFLPSPYRSYGSENCVETDKHSDVLRGKMPTGESYDFQRCRDLCLVRQASLLCSCYVTGLEIEGLPPCTAYDLLYGCVKQNVAKLSPVVRETCDCPRPCSFVRYDVVVSSSQMPSIVSLSAAMRYLNFTEENKIRDNFLELRIFFETDLVRRESHVAQYTPQSYLSSLGGQMGICMGASLISLVELLEAILYTGMVLARRFMAKVRTLAQVKAHHPRPN